MARYATPEEVRACEKYNLEINTAAGEWRDGQGGRWADRNPADVAGTDISWMKRYGQPKSYVVHDALRTTERGGCWLEVGCSAGAHMQIMRKAGFSDIYGVDLSLDGLRDAERGRVAQADALSLPFRDDAFEGLCTSGTLMHLGPTKRLSPSIYELLRVTRRYWFIVELWSAAPHMVIFGDLLPPAWLYPWEDVLPQFMDDDWTLVNCNILELEKTQEGLQAAMCVALFERPT